MCIHICGKKEERRWSKTFFFFTQKLRSQSVNDVIVCESKI